MGQLQGHPGILANHLKSWHLAICPVPQGARHGKGSLQQENTEFIASVPPAGGRVHPEGGRAPGDRLKILHDRGGHSRVLQNNPGARSALLQPINSPCSNHCVTCMD